MHTIAVLALDGVIPFDLATPIEVFGRVRTDRGEPAYEVAVAGPRSRVQAGPIVLSVAHGLDRVAGADTVIVPGRSDPTAEPDPRALRAVRDAASRGARIASICVGALDLAATGLLDGLRATTHWQATGLLADRHPAVRVDPGALFVDNGRILCSAGAAAGIDLCLHMVAGDLGGAAAAEAARTAVVPLTREAGQAQYIRDDGLGDTGLADTLRWIEARAGNPLTVAEMAASASVSVRTLNRRFAREIGTTPSAWLMRARVRHAQRLLETTTWPIDRVAEECGLGSPSNLRARFGSVVGTSPARYRRALGSSPAPTAVGLPMGSTAR